jgi:hypothetical protein
MTSISKELLDLTDRRLTDWLHRSRQWYFFYYSFGIMATALTVTVAAHPAFLDSKMDLPILAWFAALFQGLATFLGALPKATAYRAAWRILWSARMEFVASPHADEAADILKSALEKGWSMIDSGYIQPSTTSKRSSRKHANQ